MHALRAFLISFAATAVFVAIVLVSAGRVAVWQAWVYAGLSLALNVAQRVVLAPNPELTKERTRPGANARASDKVLLALGFVLTVVMLVVAGVQLRASPSLPLAWFGVGLALNASGGFLFLWALRENQFFSAVVRLQSDRKHVVCTTGPYRIVRHPGNLGMIVGALGLPLLFQSTWSFVPAVLFAVTLIVRTHLEDAMLTKELDGYLAYREQTRYRLVPGVW